jgi:phospholipase/carboxylesterase
MFKYLVKQPAHKLENPKALLMLHGFGSNEADLFSFADQLPDDLLIISARAPISLDFGGYAWYPIYIDAQGNKVSDNQQAFEVLLQLSEFIDSLIDKYNIDPSNFNLLGFSQGAILSYALAFTYPSKIKNVVALSGYINEDIMPVHEDFNQYKHLNFFVSHGLYDDIIPIELARKIPPYLDQRHIKYTYKEYPMGHEVSYECLKDMKNWIKQNF